MLHALLKYNGIGVEVGGILLMHASPVHVIICKCLDGMAAVCVCELIAGKWQAMEDGSPT